MSALAQLEPIQEATESLSDQTTRNHIRGSGLLVTGYVVELVINFLPHVLLVRYLMTLDYGAWAYALSLVAAFQTFTLCLNDGMQRFVPMYHERQEYGKLLGCVVIAFGSTLIIGGTFVAAFYLLPGPIARFLHEKAATRLLWILVALVPIEAFEVMLMRLFACFHRARLIFYLQHVIAPATRLVLVLLLIGLHKDLLFLATARVWSAALMTLLYALTLRKLVRQENLLAAFKSKIIFPLREMITFSAPMIVSTLLSALENTVFVLLLERFQGVTSVAFYRVVLPVALMNNMVMNAFSWLYVPSAARLLAKDDYSGINQLYWRTAGWITVLTFPIFAITFCFAGPLTTLLYGQRYAASGSVLALLAIANYSNVALGFNGVTLKVLGKIKYVITANFFSASLRIFLAVLLIPKFGAVGAAGAFAFSMVTYNALMQTGLRLIAGIRALEKQYLPFAALIGLSTVVLLSLRSFTANSIYLALTFTAIVSAIILFAAKKQLSIGETFPETRRLPLVGRFFA